MPPLRLAALVLAVTAALLAPTASQSARVAGETLANDDLAAGVLHELNRIRLEHGLHPLRPSVSLGRAANVHTRSMAAGGFFAHDAPGGATFRERIRRFYPGAKKAQSWSAGENLLWASPDIDPQRALELWLESPAHRANVLKRDWTEVGVAAAVAASPGGFFGGRRTTLVTVAFAVRR